MLLPRLSAWALCCSSSVFQFSFMQCGGTATYELNKNKKSCSSFHVNERKRRCTRQRERETERAREIERERVGERGEMPAKALLNTKAITVEVCATNSVVVREKAAGEME